MSRVYEKSHTYEKIHINPTEFLGYNKNMKIKNKFYILIFAIEEKLKIHDKNI